MDAFEFISKYRGYISELKELIKPELLPVLEEFESTDPHDLVTPDTCFISTTHARGYVLSLFLRTLKKEQQ